MSEMKTQVIVLGMSRYSFVDRETGAKVEGTKVHYVERYFQNEEHSIGVIPQTATMDYEFFDSLKPEQIPGVYDAELMISLRGKKPVLRIMDFHYVGPFHLADKEKAKVNLV
jgi:hypothetical protein